MNFKYPAIGQASIIMDSVAIYSCIPEKKKSFFDLITAFNSLIIYYLEQIAQYSI